MKNQYVNALQEGDYVNDYFIATRRDLRTKQDGKNFLGMAFRDKTGEIGGVMWQNANETARLYEPGAVVNVRGRVNRYQNRLQIQVDQILPLKEIDYNLADLIAKSESADEDLQRFKAILGSIRHPQIRALVDAFLEDAQFMSEFTQAAAGTKWHHEYRGGLLRHCYEMARIAETLCEILPEIDRDLLLAGIFLHDIGKLREMSHDLNVDYTDEGKLLGHLQIGCAMAEEKMRAIPHFPEHLRLQVLHFILSHHGEHELGAAVLPKTLEAIVLHHIDNLDAQASAISRIIRETREKRMDWSEFLPKLNRVIWSRGGSQ